MVGGAMDMTISVDCKRLLAALGEASRRGRNMLGAWQEIGEHMLDSVRENFRQQGRPEAWKPLSAATLLARAGGKGKATKKRGGLTKRAQNIISGSKALIASGRLINSITYQAESSQVTVGSDLPYAATHQFGRGPIPARPYLVISPADERAIGDVVSRYLTEPLQ